MRFRKGLALVLTLALTMPWCLADEEIVEEEESYIEEIPEDVYWADEDWEDEEPNFGNPFPDVPDSAD